MSFSTETETSSARVAGWRWDHSYSRLPELFFVRTLPVPVREPRLVVFNRLLAISLGFDPDRLADPEIAGIFTGNEIPQGADPIAQAYAGHQFGNFTGLGDGRAILLGEQMTPQAERFDIQLKGAGRTPFSRGGDGRAALGPMLREYIISEAMHALRIPTTRSLAVAATGEVVLRTERQPGAVLTRIAASHIRVGTFQWAAAHEDTEALRALADYTLQRHFPECGEAELPYFALFQSVANRQAQLIAQWMHVGFIHGVMNTDNMALSGETIDYGPCAFMDAYDPDTVFSSIDRYGRYAYGNQPTIARWNLSRLAEAMLPLLHEDEQTAVDLANGVLDHFEGIYQEYWLKGMRAKLGLFTEEAEDLALVQGLLDSMIRRQMDFTNTFRGLSETDPDAIAEPFPFDDLPLATWHERWKNRLERQPQPEEEAKEWMRSHNPSVIPRNHKVEEALAGAAEKQDLSILERLLAVLAHPFVSLAPSEYTTPAPRGDYQTFCGT